MTRKILIVTNMYPTEERVNWGTFVEHQVTALRDIGNTVDVYYINGRKSKWNYIKAIFHVFIKTFSTRYDIVHAHHGLSGVASILRFRAPLVITFHGSDVLNGDVFKGKFQPLLSRFASRFSDAVIVVSEELAAIIPGSIIPCGVDTSVFKPISSIEARTRVGFPLDKKIVIFPYNPKRNVKRFDLAQSAVNQLNNKGLPVILEPVYNIPNEKMPLYYSAADVMVMCSDSEGSPTSVKEALSCNTPVVSTDVGDVAQILKGIDGTVICKQTVSDIALGIENVLSRKNKHPFEGRMAMINRYDQHMIIESILQVYESVNTGRSR
jgi:teichuronic acid biosynthesis glycosyltransferase TuaC